MAMKDSDTSKPLDPAFDIGISEWLPDEYQERLKRFKSEGKE